MAHAYTPGLRVTQRAVIRKERRLPITGQVLVEQGYLEPQPERPKTGLKLKRDETSDPAPPPESEQKESIPAPSPPTARPTAGVQTGRVSWESET